MNVNTKTHLPPCSHLHVSPLPVSSYSLMLLPFLLFATSQRPRVLLCHVNSLFTDRAIRPPSGVTADSCSLLSHLHQGQKWTLLSVPWHQTELADVTDNLKLSVI